MDRPCAVFGMDDSFSLPGEALAFLVRTMAPRELWKWLSEDQHLALRHQVTRGFRATADVLRQNAARTRLVSHLEQAPVDAASLVKVWGADLPSALKEVRDSGEELLPQLPALLQKYGADSLLLALVHDEKEEALEALANAVNGEEEADDMSSAYEDNSITESAQIARLTRQLDREKQKAQRWHDKWRDIHARSGQTEKTLRATLHEADKNAREAARQLRAEANKNAQLEEKLVETQAGRERAERRAKALQPELENTQQDLKTARRQLQRLQQINEELRGQLKAPQKPAGEVKQERAVKGAAVIEKPAKAAPVPTPQTDSIIKIVEAINRNDDGFVATLRRDLQALRARDAKALAAFARKLRAVEKYYESVLTRPITRVLVDASNVARYETTRKGRLANLLAMRDELRRHNCFPILFVADASLPYNIDDAKGLRAMAARGELLITTSGQQADEILAREARATGAYVVTNDKTFHYDFAPDFTPMRIGFGIMDDIVMLEDF